MKKLEIVLDATSEEILTSLAQTHAGDRSLAIREALRVHGTMDAMLDEIEGQHFSSLRAQERRSERGFREGKFTPWEEVKKKAGLVVH